MSVEHSLGPLCRLCILGANIVALRHIQVRSFLTHEQEIIKIACTSLAQPAVDRALLCNTPAWSGGPECLYFSNKRETYWEKPDAKSRFEQYLEELAQEPAMQGA